MDAALFTNPSGQLVELERDPPLTSYVAHLPAPLPPAAEDAAIASVARELGEASLALGHLTGVGEYFPAPNLLVRPYLRREAVASSRIEGTMASFSDVVALEALERPPACPRKRHERRSQLRHRPRGRPAARPGRRALARSHPFAPQAPDGGGSR